MFEKVSISKAATHPLVRAWIDDTLGDIYEKLGKHNAVVVIDNVGHFKGIVSRKDAVKVILDRSDWRDIPVAEVMTTEVLYVPNHVTLEKAARTMLEAGIHQLVVTGPPEAGRVAIGILTLEDIVKNAT